MLRSVAILGGVFDLILGVERDRRWIRCFDRDIDRKIEIRSELGSGVSVYSEKVVEDLNRLERTLIISSSVNVRDVAID